MSDCTGVPTRADIENLKLNTDYLKKTVESTAHDEKTPNGQYKITVSGMQQDHEQQMNEFDTDSSTALDEFSDRTDT